MTLRNFSLILTKSVLLAKVCCIAPSYKGPIIHRMAVGIQSAYRMYSDGLCVAKVYHHPIEAFRNGLQFSPDIFKSIFLIEKVRLFAQTLLESVTKAAVNNMSSLVYLMTRRLFGTNPLSEPIMNHDPVHCFTLMPPMF